MGWWNDVWTTRAQSWVYGWLDSSQVPQGAPSGPVVANASYLNIFLKSARVVNVRKGLNTFYGVVHSFMRLPHRSQKVAEFNVVTTPTALQNISARVDRVVQLNHRLLGPAPYVDGDLEIEVGLFSVPSSNLAAPYLTLLEDLSKVAGVSFISEALPFAGPILNGVKLLTGAQQMELEIGLSITEPKPKQGYCVVMRAPKNAVAISSLKLDPSDFELLDADGNAIAEYPYLVLEVSAEPQRPDWYKIPDVAKAYSRIQELYRAGDPDTEAALRQFRRVALTCNDLLEPDARLLATKAETLYRLVAESDRTPRSISVANEIPDLQEVNLYS